MTGTLGPHRVVPLLRGRFGTPYRYVESCESTQRALHDDDPEGAVAVCEEQTAGRGRLGRSWHAPPRSSILCSIMLRPPPGRPAPQLSLVAGIAVAATVEPVLGLPSAVKWPNDVLVDGAKVAGILAESRGEAVVLGIGLNVAQEAAELPAGGRTRAASLLTIDGVRRDRAPLLAGLLGELERRYETWRAGGLAPLLGELERRDFLRGRRVAAAGAAGVAAGIDQDGRLVVDTPDGRVAIASGEVTYER